MSDLISRQEVIIALRESGLCYNNWLEVLGVIDAVPNAKEHIKNGDLIRRQDALDKFIDGMDVYDIMESIESLPSATSISKKDAFDAIDRAVELSKSEWEHIECEFESLPSANRQTGEWIEQEDDYHHYWECSECGMGVGFDDIRNYCPNCGADMRGEAREKEAVMWICPECGLDMHIDFDECVRCGYKRGDKNGNAER